MRASIIVPTYGIRLDYLKDTLISMQNQNYPSDQYEIIAVDNSSDDKVSTVVHELNTNGYPHVRYIHKSKRGLLDARHADAHESNGEILVYVHDDIIAPPGWLEAMMSPFDNSDVACVGGKVLPQWEAKKPSWCSQFKPEHLSLFDLGDETKEIKKHHGFSGCNMAVRKNCFFSVGGSNPEIIEGYSKLFGLIGSAKCGLEEKLYDLWFKIIYDPQAWLYHRIPESKLKPEYFYWRLFMQGVDDSYRYIRNLRIHNDQMLYLKVVKEIVLNMCRSTKSYIKSLIKKKQRIRLIADGRYWRARAGHQIITLFSKKMRKHVFQDSYL